MRKKPASAPKPDINEDQVKLKPIMGIRPGVYLTVIYSFVILVILFFLFVFPGLSNHGSVLIVKTEPAGAAIRVNDVYMGVSGSRIFLPKGSYTIETIMPGFESQSVVHNIPGRVLGSLFFPRRYMVEVTLKTADPAAAMALYARDFIEWTFAGEPTERWQIPMSLSDGAYRLGPYLNKEQKEQILLTASRFAVTRAALRDLIRAKILLDNNGNSPSPITLIGSISDIITFLLENPGSADWLYEVLSSEPPVSTISRESALILRDSLWYQRNNIIRPNIIPSSEPPLRSINFDGFTFTGIPSGNIVLEGENESQTRVIAGINSFLISENPVHQSIYETFINENPEWKEQPAFYIQEESINPLNNIYKYNITWYAARAFCQWLTNRLPASMAGMEVRLPTEIEWNYAARHGIRNMESHGWEWCADPYSPLEFILTQSDVSEIIGSPERSLRGRPSTNSTETRASLPPELSSPLVTFRPVITEKK
ncbi:MAG: SUMF1/EgtB/PvdO family nonheme iron enzyme [Treponema sp.]|nr:SUMF1/EgtB/PvdO family nonheme iron enzyme [Treponema sp.]